MTHDPLCPTLLPFNTLEPYTCQCRLIAKVRQDEKEKAREALEAQAKRIIEMADMQAAVAAAMASDDMLEKCIAAVEALLGPDDEPLRWLLDGDAVLATLRGLEDQP
jgi:two-component sensor histidine kinase